MRLAVLLCLLLAGCGTPTAPPRPCPWPADTLIPLCDLPVDTPGVQS